MVRGNCRIRQSEREDRIMTTYQHKVQYYETDKMGIVHHSNYVRWMEEARIDFLGQLGWDYAKLEESGVISPVTAIECKYLRSTMFPEVIAIDVQVEEFKGVKLKLRYTMTKEDGQVACEGHSEHCFLNQEGKIVSMKRQYPEFYAVLTSMVIDEKAE